MIVVISVITIVAFISICWYEYHYFNTMHKNRMSFKESMDLTELPVITFYIDGKKFNFLLDTGSNISHINKSLVDESKITHKKTDGSTEVYGMDGINRTAAFCVLDLVYNNKLFTDIFAVNDLNDAFNNIKKETGVTIHGIIGSKFMEKYKYVIDFNNFIAYSKK